MVEYNLNFENNICLFIIFTFQAVITDEKFTYYIEWTCVSKSREKQNSKCF